MKVAGYGKGHVVRGVCEKIMSHPRSTHQLFFFFFLFFSFLFFLGGGGGGGASGKVSDLVSNGLGFDCQPGQS